MIRFQVDADLDNDIVMAVRQRDRRVDFQTATQGKLTGLKDPEVLGVAAAQNRILVTDDRRTIPRHFRNRIESGETSPGVFIVSQFEPIGPVVEALLLIWAASDARDWETRSATCLPWLRMCSPANLTFAVEAVKTR